MFGRTQQGDCLLRQRPQKMLQQYDPLVPPPSDRQQKFTPEIRSVKRKSSKILLDKQEKTDPEGCRSTRISSYMKSFQRTCRGPNRSRKDTRSTQKTITVLHQILTFFRAPNSNQTPNRTHLYDRTGTDEIIGLLDKIR